MTDRVLFKLSGELLGSPSALSVEPVARQWAANHQAVVSQAIVLGAGNWVRGRDLSTAGVDPMVADSVGMLSTVSNGLLLQSALLSLGVPCRLYSMIEVSGLALRYHLQEARAAFLRKEVVLLTGGTGNPCVTTDTAAALRAIELGVQVLFKGTQVDGIYTADPRQNPDAKRFNALSFDEVIDNGYEVMDAFAFQLCRDHQLPIRVFNAHVPNALTSVLEDETIGTRVSGD